MLVLTGGGAAWAGSPADGPSVEALFRSGRFAEAEAALVRRLQDHPADKESRVLWGRLALLRNGLDDAERRLSEVLARSPRDRAASTLLAEARYRRDDFVGAAPLFETAGLRIRARQLAGFGARRPNRIEGPAEGTRMPFLRTDPLPVVEIRVNGSAPLRCLLDTGGAELIVAADLTGALGLVITGTENGTFGGGRKASLARGRVDSVGLGEFTVHDVPVLTLDLAAIGPAIGEPRIDAILGTSLLSRFRATLDYTGGGLVLERRASPRADVGSPAGAVEMPFWLAGDHYMLAWGAVDDGDSLLCFVDTGLAGIGFACPASTLAGAVTTPGPKARQTGMGGGGRITVAPFVVERLRLGGRARHRVDALAGVFPSSLEWEHGFRIGGLVSHQFFRQGALTLDFDTMTLRVSEPLDAR